MLCEIRPEGVHLHEFGILICDGREMIIILGPFFGLFEFAIKLLDELLERRTFDFEVELANLLAEDGFELGAGLIEIGHEGARPAESASYVVPSLSRLELGQVLRDRAHRDKGLSCVAGRYSPARLLVDWRGNRLTS